MNKNTEPKDQKISIRQLIEELQSFENQDLIVLISEDAEHTLNTVKLVGKGFEDRENASGTVYGVLHIIVDWKNRKKSIRQLIKELKTFENQDLTVVISDNEENILHPVKSVSKGFVNLGDGVENVYCILHI